MPYKDEDKQREFQARRARNRRAEFFSGKKCALCDSDKKLELHHLDKEKKDSHRIWSWSQERIDKEVSKCAILCRSCHIELHAEEKRTPIKHGTDSAYIGKGCRCELCKKAHSLVKKDYLDRVKIRKETGILPKPNKIQRVTISS